MESTHSRAKWYVIAFHYQMAALLIVVSAILILNAIFSPGIVVPPLIVPKWIFGLSAVIATPILWYCGVRTFLYARWLQGIGTHDRPLIGPPPRANCVLMTFLGVAIIGAASEIGMGNPWVKLLFFLVGLVVTFFSVCGYLWARDVAQIDAQEADE